MIFYIKGKQISGEKQNLRGIQNVFYLGMIIYQSNILVKETSKLIESHF